MRRCLINYNSHSWLNETPHKVTTFTGVAGFEHGRTCVTDIVGRIWRKRTTPTWHIYDVVYTASDSLNDIAFVVRPHVTVGIAVGDGGVVLRSSDAGANWSPVTSGTTDDLLRVVGSGKYWYAVGRNSTLLKSSDHGATWSIVSTSSTEDFQDIAVFGKTLWIAANADVLRSIDRGSTWVALAGVSGTATSVVVDRDETTWVFTFSAGTAGTIWKTTDQGATWTAHTLTGTVNNITRAALFYSGSIFAASSGSVAAPTLPELRWASGQDSIARFENDLYICGGNAPKPAPTPPSLCPADASATMWTVQRIDPSVEFGYCSPGVAFADTVYQLIQDPDDPNWPACFWKSKGCFVPCAFPGPVVAPFAQWELDTSSDPITLTFNGAATAVYDLPAAEWNHNAANLMPFASGTGVDTNHAELWLCPGDFTETFACRYCWDRCHPYQKWDVALTIPTAYEWHAPNWTGPHCDPADAVMFRWLTSGAWPAPIHREGCFHVTNSYPIGTGEICLQVNSITYQYNTYNVNLGYYLLFNVATPGTIKIRFLFILTFGYGQPFLTNILNAQYGLDVACDPAMQTMDCSLPRTLSLLGPFNGAYSDFNQNPTGSAVQDGYWTPNPPWVDLPATITITPN